MTELSWQSEVDVRELAKEPKLTEEADLRGATHVETGTLAEMVQLVLAKREPKRGRLVLTFGDRIIYRSEIENFAKRPDFPKG